MLERLKNSKNLLFLCCILGICLMSLYMGLADFDYYWQKYLGKSVCEGNFYSWKDLVWGTKGLGTYYDHEWLSNVLFYFCSCIGGDFIGVVLIKLIVALSWGIGVYLLIKEFNKDLSKTQKLSILLIVFVISTVVLKAKAYCLSSVFLMLEFIILHRYKIEGVAFNKKRFIQMLILSVVWNNMHSGSVLLLFAIAGLFWLIEARNKYVLGTGVVCFASLLLNPYGFNLVVFNLMHNFNSVMKEIVLDWRPLDTKEDLGKALFIIIVLYVVSLFNIVRKNNLFYVLCSAVLLYMTLGSARHIIYLVPIIIILLCRGDLRVDFLERIDMGYVLFIVAVLLLLVLMSTFMSDNVKNSYIMEYKDKELVSILKETNSANCDGLFSSDVDLSSIGLKTFITGCFPYVERRRVDEVVLSYGSESDIKKIIDYYGLTKFLFYSKDTTHTFYDLNKPLYDYLNNSNKYEKLYESDYYVYFVEK